MSTHTLTTQLGIRQAFWQQHPQFASRGKHVRQNDYPTDTRVAFVDFVDMLARDGQISDALAQRVTL